MAKPVITYRASVYATGAAAVYTATPTWTPAANSLIFAFVVGSAASPSDPTGVTAHGVTLTKLTLSQNSLSTVHFISMWVGDAGASPTSAAAEATWASNRTGGSIVEFEISGWASSEPVQNAFGRDSRIDTATAATGTTGTVNISLRPDVTSEHVLMSCWLHLANEATTPRTNWTETAGADGNFNSPAQGVEVQFRTDAFELTATATWSTSIDWRGYALVVRGTATTPTEIPKISDTVTARLNPDPINPGNENLKITDTLTPPVLSGGNLAPPTLTETLKLADGGIATQQGIVQLLGVVHVQDQLTPPVMDAPPSGDLGPPTISVEAIKVADTVTPARGLTASLADEPLKLADTVLVDLPLQPGLLLEGLRVSDQPPFVEERLRIADSVTAAIGGADLGPPTIAVEALPLADSVTVLENPLQTSTPAESLKVQDQGPTASMGDLTIAVTAENIKLADGGVATQQGILQLLGVIHVQDTVTAALSGQLTVTVTGELLHVQDGVPLAEKSDKYVSLTETLYLDDIGLTAVIGMDEVIHCVDQTPIAALAGGGDLTRNVGDENIKVQDTILASMGDLVVLVTQESLKVQDTVTVSENPLSAAPAVESLIVQDSVSLFENPLFAAPATENLKVQDTLQASTGGLFASGFDELLRVQDSFSGSETPLLAALTDESIKVQDSVSVSENPLQTSTPAESLKVQDTLTTSMGGLVVQITPDELLHVQDTLLASMGGLVTAVTENLKIQDAIANITLNPEQTTLTVESLKVADTVSVGLELSVAVTNEALKVQDTVSAATGRAVVVTDESLKIQDSLSASLTVLRASPAGESLKIQDSVSLGVDLLSVVVGSEVLHIQDIWVVTATPDVVVRVRPDVEVIHIRPDTGTVRV